MAKPNIISGAIPFHSVYICCILFLSGTALSPLKAQCNFNLLANGQTGSTIQICAGEALQADVINPENNTEYHWDLNGDGQLDTTGTSIDFSSPVFFVDTTITISLFQDDVYCNSQDVLIQAAPDPSIGVPPGIVVMNGNSIKVCNGSNSFDLEIFNASQTFAQNVSYTINWGDGTPPETFDNSTFNNTSTISHTYAGLGYFPLFVTATHENGCIYTQTYTFYNGGNPSVGLAIPGNTVGLCAPATLDFPIINADNNPPGTEYHIFINGAEVGSYNQETLPDAFTYTFEESSCGLSTSTGNYMNAFDIQIVASNPCNSSTATIEPIEVSAPPTPFFEVDPPASICPGANFVFSDASMDVSEVVAGSPSSCLEVLNPSWTVSGQNGEDWMLVNGNLFGSSQIEVQFLEPGVYTIEMTIVSFACGPFTFSQEIVIEDAPVISANFDLEAAGQASGGCAPFELPLNANASGTIEDYQWTILPEGDGWMFSDSLSMDSAATTVVFTEGGQYSIQLEATNACATTSWDTLIQIQGLPEIELAPLPDFCESANISIEDTQLMVSNNGSPISSYTWTFEGSDTPTSSDMLPQNISYGSPGEYVISLTANNACGSQTVFDTFQVQQQTLLELPPNQEICASANAVQLTPSPAGGIWQGTGVSESGLFDPTQANIGANMLNYSYGVAACQIEDFMTITVLPAPEVMVNPDESICENGPDFDLTANVPDGQWYNQENEEINTTTIPTDSLLPGTHFYWYVVENEVGCFGADTVELTILTTPEIIVPDSSYCNTPGNVFLPQASLLGGQWSGIGVSDANEGLFDPILAGGSGVYDLIYSYEAENGCIVDEPVQIGVIAPEAVDAGPHQNVCQSAPILDMAATPPGGHWSVPQLGLSELPNPSDLEPGNYLFVYQVGEGNCEVEDSLQVNILPIPVVEAGPPESFCPSSEIIDLNGFSPEGGEWSGQGINNNALDINELTTGSYTLTYAFTDPITGCVNEAEKTVTIHPSPIANFDIPENACIQTAVMLNNTSSEAIAYEWLIDDAVSVNTINPTYLFEESGMHYVQLTASNSFGCSQMLRDSLFIIGLPEAEFVASANEDCGELQATFENLSAGYETTYMWDFGNGENSIEAQPDIPITFTTNENDEDYVVSLTATNECGTDTWLDTLWVRAFPVADFGFTVDTGCSPLQIEFNNISLGSPGSFLWDFGNGTTSTDSLPEPQIYEAIDTFTSFPVSLIYTNLCGSDTLLQEVVVEPEEITAFFNLSNTQGCAPFEVQLENVASPGTQVQWDFGDGNLSAQENPSHIFAQAGTYTITQTVHNSCTEDSISLQINVLPSPELSFESSPNLCDGQQVQFTNTSTEVSGVVWNFGDGNQSEISNPQHTYDEPGNYTIHLQGIAPSGCENEITADIEIIPAPSPSFALDTFNGCAPLDIQITNQSEGGQYYLWQFGDGNSSVASSPSHTYLEDGHYEITLTVTNDIGCESLISLGNIFAFPVPVAQFEIDKEQACGLPQIVTFTNNSIAADGFHWRIGDLLESNLVSPAQTFYEPGTTNIQLTASNQYGCEDVAENTLELYETPVAEFSLDTLEGCQDLRAQFQNFSTGQVFLWDFGDGTTSTEVSPVHVYTEAGMYNVTLISAFGEVCYDTLELESLVTVWRKPQAAFSWQEQLLDGNSTGDLQFVNESIDASHYLWDFGNSDMSEEENPSYRFLQNGIWKVQLTAFSPEGCRDDSIAILPHDLIKGLFVPNAFSPLDGIGETTLFMPKGVGLKEYRLQIFSPYGQLLWESTKLDEGEPKEGWDGRLNGELLPQDVYVWKINAIFEDQTNWRGQKVKGGSYKRMGSVTLLR